MSFLLKNNQAGLVYLCNCPEGSQHVLNKLIKYGQVSSIIVTNLNINNIAGILGLLSTCSLNSRAQLFTIYGPPGLLQYVKLIHKYSHTAFRYVLKLCIIKSVYINFNASVYLHSYLINQQDCAFLIVEHEVIGRLNSSKTYYFQLLAGPLYKNLKKHYKFILPDGSVIFGKYFTGHYYVGTKTISLLYWHNYRSSVESYWGLSNTLLFV